MEQTMARELIGGGLVLAVLLLALYIYQSVRRRRAAQESVLPDIDSVPVSEKLFDCLYVATVYANNPLERIWAYGLAGRGRAQVGSASGYLVINRTGERDLAIPLSSIERLGRGGATIDRGVEKSGLVQIQWRHGQHSLLTSLRITTDQERNYLKLKEVVDV
jgi:hypothetical protein